MQKAMIIINPYAGKQRAKDTLFELIDILYEHGFLAEVYPTRGPNDATQLVLAHATGYDIVVCCGGDGTLHEVIAGLMELADKPPLGYIPAGTTNDLATSLQIPKDVGEAARSLVSGNTFDFDIGTFNQETFFTYIAAFGALTDVSYTTPQTLKSKFGHFAYVLSCIKTFIKAAFGLMPCFHARLEFDDQVVEDDFVICAITNSTYVAGVFQLSQEHVRFDDGLFEMMMVRYSRNPFSLLAKVSKMMRQKYDSDGVKLVKTSKVRVTAPNGLDWCLDGENGGQHTDVTIENLPRRIRFLVGEQTLKND